MKMASFAPKIGSIAHVAMVDPKFEGCKWVYDTHQATGAFATYFSDCAIKYTGQRLVFESVRDTSVFDLETNQLNLEQTRLNPHLQDQLYRWLCLLQQCEDLISDCEQESSRFNQVAAHPGTKNSSGANGWIRTWKNSTKNTQMDRKPFSMLRLSRRKSTQRAAQASVNRPENPLDADTFRGRDNPSHLREDYRRRFETVLNRLEEHANLISPSILSRQMPSVAPSLLDDADVEERLQHCKEGGNGLLLLLQALEEIPNNETMTFQLMLHRNPFKLQDQSRQMSNSCRQKLLERGPAFCMRIQSHPDFRATTDSSNQRILADGSEDVGSKHLLFGVSPGSTDELIRDLQLHLNAPSTTVTRTDWATYVGKVGNNIDVFVDSTQRSNERAFVSCLDDSEEQRVLQKPDYASFRARLALTAASSLFFLFQVEDSHGFEAHDLSYFAARDENDKDTGYRLSRINPFVPLRRLGLTTIKPSSAYLLSEASGTELPTSRMIRNLGILIYEIGAWTRITQADPDERVRTVEMEKDTLIQHMTTMYSDVITSCIEFQGGNHDIDRWLVKHVLMPLDRTITDIDNLGLLPT